MRVSTEDQNLELQHQALEEAGCERFFSDTASGKSTNRVGLNDALSFARRDDIIVVWRLDRLGRSLTELITLANDMHDRGVGLASLAEAIDTSTSGGRLVFHVFGAIAEFERNLIRERTLAGLAVARSAGRRGGRPRKLTDEDVLLAKKMMVDRTISARKIANRFDVSVATLYRNIATRADNSSP